MADRFRLLTPVVPGANFSWRNIQPPGQQYVDSDDALFITSANAITGVTIEIRVRILLPGRRGVQVLAYTHTPNSDRTAKTDVFKMGEGFILSLSAFASGATTFRGATYATIGLCRGSGATLVVMSVLVQDYLTNTVTVSWPGNVIRAPGEGPGWVHNTLGTRPPAGTPNFETIPANSLWRIISLRVTLSSDPAGPSRFVRVFFTDGTNTFFKVENPVGQGAGTVGHYTVYQSGNSTTIILSDETLPGPAGQALIAGWTIQTDTAAGNFPADQWDAPSIAREEWVVL